jgi:hypothetical protein
MKKTMIILLALLPFAGIAGWLKTTTQSNGTTAVVIVAAPSSGTNRVVTANGGLKVYNGWTNSVTFYIRETGATTNIIEKVTLDKGYLYIADFVHILAATNATMTLDCVEACSNSLSIYTHYRDEAQ